MGEKSGVKEKFSFGVICGEKVRKVGLLRKRRSLRAVSLAALATVASRQLPVNREASRGEPSSHGTRCRVP